MEPLALALAAIAPDHLAKRHPVAVAVRRLVRVVYVHVIFRSVIGGHFATATVRLLLSQLLHGSGVCL